MCASADLCLQEREPARHLVGELWHHDRGMHKLGNLWRGGERHHGELAELLHDSSLVIHHAEGVAMESCQSGLVRDPSSGVRDIGT